MFWGITSLGHYFNNFFPILQVFYNNINVFKRAREGTGHPTAHDVSWICSPEFDADRDVPISFLDDDSYSVLHKPTSRSGDRWSFEFRTIEPFGTLLSNIPRSTKHDYMMLEIVQSKLRLLVGKGSNAVELIPDRNVSDGKWHNVSITYSPMLVDVSSVSNLYSVVFRWSNFAWFMTVLCSV